MNRAIGKPIYKYERKNNNYRIFQVETLEVESCRKRKLNKRETSTPVKKKTEDEFLKTIFSLSFTPFFGQIYKRQNHRSRQKTIFMLILFSKMNIFGIRS